MCQPLQRESVTNELGHSAGAQLSAANDDSLVELRNAWHVVSRPSQGLGTVVRGKVDVNF